MKELTVEAKIENLETVINFVTKFLHNENCSFKTITKFEIAIDELFSNIAYYAYKDEIGYVKVILEVVEK